MNMKYDIFINLRKGVFSITALFLLALFPLLPSFALAQQSITVVTHPASFSPIFETVVYLNGHVSNPRHNTKVLFEYGKNYSSLEKTTQLVGKYDVVSVTIPVTDLEPGEKYYYRLVAMPENTGETIRGQRFWFIAGKEGSSSAVVVAPPTQPPATGGASPVAVTRLVGAAVQGTAILNGLALSGSAIATYGWFQWGASASLGEQTLRRSLGSLSSVEFSETISGLSSGGTLYYYRAVVQNARGTSYGSTLSFRTGTTVILATVPATDTTVAANPSTGQTEGGIAFEGGDDGFDALKEKSLAALFFAGDGFFPDTLLGWLFLVVLIFSIIALSNHFYGTRQKKKDEKKSAEKEKVENVFNPLQPTQKKSNIT